MNDLMFDFTVDKEAKKVYIQREFAAELALVWEAFTTAALLDRWVAPAPAQARTKYMNFEVGGARLYAMILPGGEERWAIQRYTSITPMTNFQYYNAFCDAEGNPEAVGSEWDHTFSEQDGITTVRITIYNESYERMERIMEGFRLGFTASLVNLDKLLAELQN